jgi:muramoyltetrapeptide carboxypeptidase
MSKSEYHILVVAPSGRVDRGAVEAGINLLKSRGHKVETGQYLFEENGPFAGSDIQRLEDLQWAIDHTKADLIWMARGGYGLTRIIDLLNTRVFREKPKLIIGYSDITALFLDQRIEAFPVCHGPMIQNLNEKQLDVFEGILRQFAQKLKCESNRVDFSLTTTITGGNLSLITNHLGIIPENFFKGKTLLIEEIAEYDYKIDRMLVQLIRANIISQLDALMLGGFTETEAGRFPLNGYLDLLLSEADKHSIPVISNIQVGHIEDNHPILLNSKSTLNYRQGVLNIHYENAALFDL